MKGATFYENDNFTGWGKLLPVGYYATANELEANGVLNDKVSSIKIDPGVKVIAWVDADRGGKSITLTADKSSLFADGFNDNISSIEVIDLQASSVPLDDTPAGEGEVYHPPVKSEGEPKQNNLGTILLVIAVGLVAFKDQIFGKSNKAAT